MLHFTAQGARMALPPVVWEPSPNFGYPSPGSRGRMGQPVRVTVRHRIVGSLASADTVFADVARGASTHFGIGHIDGRLEIHQYVNLSDAAWGNGDVREPTAKVVLENPGVNPNLYSVSIEHEDGSSAGHGIVKPDTWAASIALGVLLASGDIAKIRNAGIRIRDDETTHQLAKIPPTVDGHIDHQQIAGPNKPYCWRVWLDDPGFVKGTPSRRDELLKALSGITATEEEVTAFSDCRDDLKRCRGRAAKWHAGLLTAEAELEALKADPTLARIEEIKAKVAALAADVGDD
jgi:hypothetical protein